MKDGIKIFALVLLIGGSIMVAAYRHGEQKQVIIPTSAQAQVVQAVDAQKLNTANVQITKLQAQVKTLGQQVTTERSNLCAWISQHYTTRTIVQPAACQ